MPFIYCQWTHTIDPGLFKLTHSRRVWSRLKRVSSFNLTLLISHRALLFTAMTVTEKKGPYGDSGDRFAADKFSWRLRSSTEVHYTVNIDSEQVWRSGNGLSWWADGSRFESASGQLLFTNCGLRILSYDWSPSKQLQKIVKIAHTFRPIECGMLYPSVDYTQVKSTISVQIQMKYSTSWLLLTFSLLFQLQDMHNMGDL